MDLSAKALTRIAWQYRNGAKFREWIDTLPAIAQTELEDPLQSIIDVLDIDNANTWQLNVIGAILGQGRTDPLLSDDDLYRIVLRAKIYKNTSSALIDGIVRATEAITGVGSVELSDNQDMSFLLYFDEPLDPDARTLLQSLDIVPRPQAVRLGGFVETTVYPWFGFDGTGTEEPRDNVEGFGELGITEPLELSDGSDLELSSGGTLEVFYETSAEGYGGQFAELYEVA